MEGFVLDVQDFGEATTAIQCTILIPLLKLKDLVALIPFSRLIHMMSGLLYQESLDSLLE